MPLTSGQQRALDFALSGKNLFITGSGGVGKSFLIQKIIDDLSSENKNVLVTASTGKAALLVKGVTCHRAFRIPIKSTWECEPKITTDSPVYEADVVLIDEVSMLRMDAFEFIVKSIEKVNQLRKEDSEYEHKKRNSIQIIVVGDFCQLPPVISNPNDGTPDDGSLMSEYYGFDVDAGYAFLSLAWKRCNFITCELTEVLRQSDKELISIENRIRFGDFSALSYFDKCVIKRKRVNANNDAVYLCGKKKTAEKINEVALSKLSDKKERKYRAVITGDVSEQDKPAPQVLTLKCGAHVVMLLNTEEYTNGSSATITAMYPDHIHVKIWDSDNELDIPMYTWSVERYVIKQRDGKRKVEKEQIGTYSQLPIRLGYAITIHKAQGQTLDKAVLVLGNDGSEIFTYGQFYVGISRIKSIDKLKIDGNPNLIKCLADQSVLKFYGKNPFPIPSSKVTTEEDVTELKEKEEASKPEEEPIKKEKEEEIVLKTEPVDIKDVEKVSSEKYSGYVEITCSKFLQKTVMSYARIKDPSAKLLDNTLYVTSEKAKSVQEYADSLASSLF